MTDTKVPATQAPRTAPEFIHELFWGQISSLLGEQLQRYQPSMGTVSGATGAYLLVLPDGSATPRKMAHLAGRRFNVGDRVVFGPVKGQPVVYGGVLTATGAAEAVITGVDIAAGSITTAHLVNGAVTAAKLGSDVTARFDGIDTRIGVVDGKAIAAQGDVNDVKSRTNIGGTALQTALNKADNAVTTNALNTAINGVLNLSGATTSTPLDNALGNGQQAHTRLQNNIDPRMDVVCNIVCGNSVCRKTTNNNALCTAVVS